MEDYVGQTILGQFRILQEIGRGGMGAVYKAEQPDMDRLVAVKILHPRLASRSDLVLRFRREARAMSRLTHPNTVRVLLFGQLDTGALYIVMEFLDGKNLLQVERKEGPLDPVRAGNIMIQVCGALGEAHQQGIVHRDLKPENIVLSTQGGIADFPKVLDFGLAKMKDPPDPKTGSMRALTQQGAVFGTPEFMSPEQARGEVLDERSDIYSLCVILYEMVTCKLPFKAKSPMDFITQHIKGKPIPVNERVAGLPLTEKHWVVMEKALTKDKENRYQTTIEFAEALKSWVNGSKAEHYLPAHKAAASAAPAQPEAPAAPEASPPPQQAAGAEPADLDVPDESREISEKEETGLSKGVVFGLVGGLVLLFITVVALVIILLGMS
jgi:serine/threonine-protein kinase